jgi:hypothetical protein
MDIISTRGEMKAIAADVSVIGSAGTEIGALSAKVTSAAALSRDAGTTSQVDFDTLVSDTANMWRPATSTARLYVPQAGWYFVNFYITTTTAVAHQATTQLWANRSGVSNYFGYNKRDFAAGSGTYPNMLSATGLVYALAGDYFNVHWGSSGAITSLTGVAWVGFGVWKVG